MNGHCEELLSRQHYGLPIAPWGWAELVSYGLPLLLVAVLLLVFGGGLAPLAALPATAVAGLIWFFRDPRRPTPRLEGAYLSPADGRVTDITALDQYDFLEGPASRVGVFLSLLDVHVNRAPADATVIETHYAPGARHDARSTKAAARNESQWIGFAGPGGDRFAVRQVSGAVARRIVCPLTPGRFVAAGERFGMIKFGSRAELIVPQGVSIVVGVGDRVKAGVTVLAQRC